MEGSLARRLAPALLAVALSASPGASAAPPPSAEVALVPSRFVPPSVRTLVFLPPSYGAETARRFPVLYFLHDGRGSETTLLDRGIAAELEGAMRAGTLPEALVVAPRGGRSWFVDSYGGHVRYARFLSEELVPFVDARWRTLGERRGRAALGISMGGYGALHWAFTRPEELAAVGGLSPAVEQLDWRAVETMPFFLRPLLTDVFGRDARRNGLRRNDLYDILLSNPGVAPRAPEILVRCGTEDRYRLGEVSVFFGKYLTAMGVRNEVTVEHGRHEWSYWRRVFLPMTRALLEKLR